MLPDPWHRLFAAELSRLEDARLLRRRRVVRPIDAMHVEVDGRALVNFASNDYLGLTHHPRVVDAFRRATDQYGVGSGAAPLVTGYTPAHASAERALAAWKGTESAVLFSSGYQANVAVVHALAAAGRAAGRPVRFLLDKLCHASLVDAVRGAADSTTFRVYPHNGTDKLARLLDTRAPESLNVIVTESIFSMDGDAADLSAIARLKQQHGENGPLLLLDEAHGSGVYGNGGAGLAAELGVRDAVDATVVTLSKAVGVVGAAVCGSAALCEMLVNLGRPYIYSTSVPAAVAAAAEASIHVMADEPHRQQRVRAVARHLRAELAAAGFDLPPGDSPIVPILLGAERTALAAADRLREAGLLALAIRPPTVPRGTSRLRITLSSEHTDDEVAALLSALRTLRPAGK
jgi:8-amino-7-oxononanoate synthase